MARNISVKGVGGGLSRGLFLHVVALTAKHYSGISQKMPNRPPAFQYYPKDQMGLRIQRMSLEAQGAYHQIRGWMWSDSQDFCSIANDKQMLKHMLRIDESKCSEVMSQIQWPGDPLFLEENGLLVCVDLREQIQRLRELSLTRSRSGRKGGKANAKQMLSKRQASDKQKGSSSSSPAVSSSPSSAVAVSGRINLAEPDGSGEANGRHRRNEIWDALSDATNVKPETKTERKLFGKLCRELKEAGATPDTIQQRASNYRRKWPNVDMTPTALIKHWGELAAAVITPQDRQRIEAEERMLLERAENARIMAELKAEKEARLQR